MWNTLEARVSTIDKAFSSLWWMRLQVPGLRSWLVSTSPQACSSPPQPHLHLRQPLTTSPSISRPCCRNWHCKNAARLLSSQTFSSLSPAVLRRSPFYTRAPPHIVAKLRGLEAKSAFHSTPCRHTRHQASLPDVLRTSESCHFPFWVQFNN